MFWIDWAVEWIRRSRGPSTFRAGKWWSELHRAAKGRPDRATGHKGKVLARVWEKQKRGLAHVHGVIAVSKRQAERAWAKSLRRLL